MIVKFNPMSKVYYLPTNYYWLDESTKYENVLRELEHNMSIKKRIYEELTKKMYGVIEKTDEYKEYKSYLIRIILCKYAHNNPDRTGKELINEILDKSSKDRENFVELILFFYKKSPTHIFKNKIEKILKTVTDNINDIKIDIPYIEFYIEEITKKLNEGY